MTHRGLAAGAAAPGLLAASGAKAHEIKVLASRLAVEPGHGDTVYLSWGHILPIDAPIAAEADRAQFDVETFTATLALEVLP